MQVISVGLLEFVSNYSYPICSVYWNVLGIGSSRYWQCSIWITTKQRQLGDSQAMTHDSKFSQYLIHSSQNFRMSAHLKKSRLLTRQYAVCGRVFFLVCMKEKPLKYWIKMFELCEAKTSYVYSWVVYAGALVRNWIHTGLLVSVVRC